ncbi:MAG: AAA family ATPase, partial [Desulfobacterales bacterium]|nr:AAA family ATPase [Desulfobacterales bacterium]
LEIISQQSSNYEKNIKIYKKDANNNKDKLEKNFLSLKVRQWLSQQKKAIKEEIERLNKIHQLKMAKQLTNTSTLSRKKGELAEVLITNAFVDRFNTELEHLGATKIKIELVKTRTEKGKVLHQLKLKGVNGIITENILSEGEYKIISLAAFFADVEGKKDISPFVFDDPISSLDQDFEEAVVKRLVELAKKRQVIIFTHRLSLLGMIQEDGKKENIIPIINCVRHEPWGTGEPGETPLFARKPASALNDLIKNRVAIARKLYKEKGQEVSYPYVKAICSDFRTLLERMIEVELLADVVQRHRRAVHTTKIDKLVKINRNDCNFFDEMMTKYSRYEHSQSDEAPVALPEPDELDKDLNNLKKWYDNFTMR